MLQLPTYDDVRDAAARISSHAHRTPVLRSRLVNESVGADVVFKCENLQRMGAFKFRGAFNALSRFTPEQRRAGVVAYSSGNHAQAVALAALYVLRPPLRTAAPLLVLVLVLPLSPLTLSPAPPPPVTTRTAALPDSPQAGVICLWLHTVGVSGLGAPADHAARARLGETLRGSDDDLLRQVGELFLRGARTRSQDLEGLAWTAFVRRCDHLRRYRDAPVPEPVSPFPTEGW
ncbi:pyridoxal-phosphate dependent enzyme [Streptosporangium algeriense]|uniref:Pyridoxal-phosphate dependent enzyme n=1 Tax=Streptosporangium algeriense TaxID=1682748 RepID=A0ABW3DYN6_9ACTN